MSKFKIGVIGNGFVGGAISFLFSSSHQVYTYDINPNKSKDDLNSIYKCDFVFVCVPTPMFKDGSQDLSFVYNVFKNAENFPVYILKSTVLPGTTNNLIKKHKNLKIIFSPEFLREKTSKIDILNQDRIILGGDKKLTNFIKKLFQSRFESPNIIEMSSISAEFVKYMNNTFLATKVSIMNEFKILSDIIGVEWKDAIHGFISDKRIGNSHYEVPGHDGKLGYGGTCFPKDVSSLLNFSQKHNINLSTIRGGWETNLKLRHEKDWENDYGRSISYKKLNYFSKIGKIAITAALKASKAILKIYESENFETSTKNDNSPLTRADIEANRIIFDELKITNLPILSEEGSKINYKKRHNWKKFWIVDPIDGTKEFINKNGEFTINIGLIENGVPVLGVVYVPVHKDLFFAEANFGSFKYKEVMSFDDIKNINTENLKESSLPKKYTIVVSKSHMNTETQNFVDQKQNKYGEIETESFGSSLKICKVAEGRAHCYPRFGPTMEWDTAAAHAIAKYAGCSVYNAKNFRELKYNKIKLLNPFFVVEKN